MPAPRPPVRWARFLASLLAIGLAGLAVALIVPRVVPERSSPGPVDPEVNPEEIVHLHALGVNPGSSEEHTSELQFLIRISYAVFCLLNTLPLFFFFLYSLSFSLSISYL